MHFNRAHTKSLTSAAPATPASVPAPSSPTARYPQQGSFSTPSSYTPAARTTNPADNGTQARAASSPPGPLTAHRRVHVAAAIFPPKAPFIDLGWRVHHPPCSSHPSARQKSPLLRFLSCRRWLDSGSLHRTVHVPYEPLDGALWQCSVPGLSRSWSGWTSMGSSSSRGSWLRHVVLENFITYAGSHTIAPFDKVSRVRWRSFVESS